MRTSIFALAALAATALAGKHHHHDDLHHQQMHKGHGEQQQDHGDMHHGHHDVHGKLHGGDYPAKSPAPPAVTPPAAENATCGCTTVWTTWTGPGVLIQPAPTQTPAAPAPPAPVATYVAKPAPAPAPAPASSNTTSAPGHAGSGKNWAIAYSPYQGASSSSSSCKPASLVSQEIAAIAAKGFSAVRIYATDCNQVEYVGNACKQYGLKMIIGVFIESAGICQDSYDQLNDIVSYFNGDYSMVELVAIGNEALFNNYCSGSELAGFISHCASTLKSAGYTGPITTTDTVAAFQANSAALCPVIDVVAANMYSFFNGNVAPEDSGTFIAGQVSLLEKSCPNKEVYNLECGWPTSGPNYMNAVPSAENQAAFVKSVMESDSCGHTVFFTAENDGWKNDGTPSVEPYFGCLDQFE